MQIEFFFFCTKCLYAPVPLAVVNSKRVKEREYTGGREVIVYIASGSKRKKKQKCFYTRNIKNILNKSYRQMLV